MDMDDHPESGHCAWVGPAPDGQPQDTSAPTGTLVAGDNMEKKVHMNEDGSLSVEMKVRFQLLGEDALLWSQRVGCAGILTATSGGPPVLGEANPLCCRKEGHSWGFSEPGTGGLGPLDAGYQGVSDRDWWPGPSYEIWRNPLCTTQGEGPAPQRRSGPVRCMAHWRQGPKGRKRHGKDSVSPALRTGSPEGSEPDSCDPRTPEGGVATNSPCSASMAAFQSWASQEAGQSPCPGGAGPGGWGHCSYLGSGTWGIEKVLSDSPANLRSHEQSCKLGSQPLSCLSQARAVTSQGKAIQCDSSCAPALSPSSLSNEDLQGEKCGQGAGCHQARDGPLTRLLFGLGHSGSWDTEGGSAPPPLCAPSQQGRKKQQRPASAMSPPNLPNLPQVTQNDHARQCHYCRDTHCPLDSTAAPQTPRPPDRGRACPGGPVPRFSQNSPSNRKQDSQDLRLPSPSSFDSRDLPVASRVITQMSHSDSSPRFYHPSTRSVEPVGDSEEGEPGAHQGCYRAYRTEFPALSIPSGHTQIPQGRLSEDCWVCSSHCPTPPADPSCAKKPPVSGRSSFSGHQKAVDGARPGKVLLGMYPDARGGLEEQEEDSDVMPTALPHSSPDTVVREWLGNIPEEPVLMTYEMVAETTNVLSDGQEGSKDFSYNHFLKSLGEPAQTRCQPLEGDTDEHPEIAGALLGTADAEPKSETGSHQDAEPGEVSIAPAEVGAGKRVTGGCGGNLRALPGRVSTSTQLMKALMGCKPGRPSSLPEVSSAVATRLSHSAGALITCLARLHFSEEDLGSLGDKARLQHSPWYQELLNISQTLWPGCSLRQGQLDLGLRALTPQQALPVTEGFTPTSSSGVDVSSGSGGSGEEGSVPCVMDSILVPEKMELPLKISSSQRPNSRTSGHSEDVEPPQPSCSPASSSSQAWACATSREEAERGSRKQPSGSNLEQLVENTMQEEKKQLEETERERPQEEGVEEEDPPEGAEVSGQEVPEAGSKDGEGSCEDKGVSEEEAGKAPASAGPCSLGRTERPAEDPGHLSRRLSESPSGPSLEPGLEEPRAAVIGHEQAQAKSSPGSEEKNTSMACRTPLDPDSTWVSKLLKKMEKAFMGHLARAMAELRARWSLQDNSLLDQMVAELEQDVGQRLQGSTEKELRKIQSWVGRRVLGPPRGGLQGQTSLQTEQRRHRLRTLHNLSAFPEQTHGLGSLSLTLEDWPTLGTALETRLDEEAMGDELCPCKACVRKKVTLLSPKDTTGTGRAPIRKAFDLQQILQQKKGECTDGEAVEMVPKKKGTQEDPLRAGTVQRVNGGLELGLSPGPRVGEEGKEEDGSQRPSGDKAPEFREVEGQTTRRGRKMQLLTREEGKPTPVLPAPWRK
uniref:Retinitis pigmentosa 1-like 1 protein n=1 Tax=Castor canadensis TaxID=51338 RepID=A0A8C0WX90_CASCN